MPLLVDCVFKIKETVDSFKYEQLAKPAVSLFSILSIAVSKQTQ